MTISKPLEASSAVLAWAGGPWLRKTPDAAVDTAVTIKQETKRSTKTVITAEPNKPTIPASDKGNVNNSDIISAAVIIDVLTTLTTKLDDAPTILADLAAITLTLLNIGKNQDGQRAQRLMQFAISNSGFARATLSKNLISALQHSQNINRVCTPHSVAGALRKIEEMGQIIIREALAVLEARETTVYHQV
ncbi:MAG: hypothetical protein JW841_15995 [Deltaproteobacteria bacterium]|nr:hypothetical protein [Deltaproteobacteria bacterium]